MELLNSKGEAVYKIEAPFMFDNDGNKSTDLTLSITEQKKNKLLSDMIQNDTDKKMVQLVEAATDLSCGDICTLLEVAHSLPFVGNLEGGDTYINVLTREKESMVIAQYRHPNYDLYKRSIIGEIERREDEPAVYRALEEGISGRGLIGQAMPNRAGEI